MATTSSQTSRFKDVRLHKVFERILPEGGTRKHVGHTRPRDDPIDDGILTVYQLRDAKGELRLREGYVEIVSQTLQDFVRTALEGYPEPDLNTSPMRFRYPYFPFLHLHERIEKLVASFEGGPTEKKHLQYLLKFIFEELKDDLRDFKALKDFSSEITFKQLWTCFVPGQIVVKRDEVHCEECYEIKGIKYTPEYTDNPEHTFFLVSGGSPIVSVNMPVLTVTSSTMPVHTRTSRVRSRHRSPNPTFPWHKACLVS